MRNHPTFCAPLLTLALLTACGPSPNTTPSPSPSATPTAAPSASPTSAPTSEPSVQPSSYPSPTPQATATASPSTSPTSSPSPGPSVAPTPQPAGGPSQETLNLRDNFFRNYGENPFVEAATDALSTFSADVDTASYAIARSYLNGNQLPPPAAVRTEEFVNAFNYHYPQPISGKFAIQTDLAPAFFGDGTTKLLRVGIQGLEVLDKNRLQANLTFVIDVSGSMNLQNRLELVKQSLRLLLNKLNPTDRVGIVIYGTTARVALAPTPLSNKSAITAALDTLRPEGSTNAEAGLTLGYAEAARLAVPGAINRVILCSDGVANVGETGPEAMLAKIEAGKAAGITLTTLGFGLNGYNDTLMEQLADRGDGNYGYIDSLAEAQTLLVDRLTSTLQVIAKDAKIQVAFDPALVDQYRLLGYENRDIADQDFTNDRVDAGEIGSNHSVTALYEVRFKADAASGNFATVTLRYKDVDQQNAIREVSRTVSTDSLQAFSNVSGSFRLATAVAEFAEILRQSVFARTAKLSEVVELAKTAQQAFPDDAAVQAFVNLSQKAADLQQPPTVQSLDDLLKASKNPQALSSWESFLLKQLSGKTTP